MIIVPILVEFWTEEDPFADTTPERNGRRCSNEDEKRQKHQLLHCSLLLFIVLAYSYQVNYLCCG